jgi:hypothetical protein
MSGSLGTIKSPSNLYVDEPDNTSGLIAPVNMRNLAESAFALITSPNGVKVGNYTPSDITDRGTIVPFNAGSAVSYTIPTNATLGYPVNTMLGLLWVSGAAGQPSFAGAGGVTIVTPTGNRSARVAGSIIWAWQYLTNTWILVGDLT